MKNKILLVGLFLIMIFNLTACKSESKNAEVKNEDGIKFKEEYESLNGKIGGDSKI